MRVCFSEDGQEGPFTMVSGTHRARKRLGDIPPTCPEAPRNSMEAI